MIILQGYPLYVVAIDDEGTPHDASIPIVAWRVGGDDSLTHAYLADGRVIPMSAVQRPGNVDGARWFIETAEEMPDRKEAVQP